MDAIDQNMKQGVINFIILISSPGGSVFYGLSAYNYLKGIPATITTHNFGSVDSIGVVLYCGGSKRLSVPQARFLLQFFEDCGGNVSLLFILNWDMIAGLEPVITRNYTSGFWNNLNRIAGEQILN